MFQGFPKTPRIESRWTVTEKIDGTNAQILITPLCDNGIIATVGDMHLYAGSRNRWLTPSDDNFGFAAWVVEHAEELVNLGQGRHFGEWWGSGIQRNYGYRDGTRVFSLFNTKRWSPALSDEDWSHRLPECCSVVPILYDGIWRPGMIDDAMQTLRLGGSLASPGFDNPEGIVLYSHAAGMGFKHTFEKKSR